MSDTEPPPPRLEHRPSLRLVGLVREYAMDDTMLPLLPAQWAEFGPRMAQIADEGPPIAFGVALPSNVPERFRYMTAVPGRASAAPPDMAVVDLPAGRYRVHRHEGHVSSLNQTVGEACHGHAPPSDTPSFLEYYGPGFDPDTGLGDIEVWIPVREER